jgi:hypothetical protein
MLGSCNLGLDRWYFDSNTRTCQRFKYNGCLGNQNNFVNRDTCEDKCGQSIISMSDFLTHGSKFFKLFSNIWNWSIIDLNLGQTVCEFNIYLDPNCTINETDANILSSMTSIEFYFDVDARACKAAVGGCISPDIPNRFTSLNECMNQCVSNTTSVEATKGRILKSFDYTCVFLNDLFFQLYRWLPVACE